MKTEGLDRHPFRYTAVGRSRLRGAPRSPRGLHMAKYPSGFHDWQEVSLWSLSIDLSQCGGPAPRRTQGWLDTPQSRPGTTEPSGRAVSGAGGDAIHRRPLGPA